MESTLSAKDFEFVVPSDLGVPNLDQFDFCSEVSYEEEEEEYWARSADEEDRGEEDSATEGEEEEEEEEDEEEDEEEEEGEVPLLTKGVVSGVRSATEIPPPVSEVGGTSRDAREGWEEDRSVATAVRSEPQSGVESVPVVPTAPENATEVVRPLGDLSDEVPPAGERTPHEDQLGGNESEEVSRVGEEATLAAEGAPADVQPESGTRVEGEKTAPATEGATLGVPEEGDQGRVQFEGDVSPPEVEG